MPPTDSTTKEQLTRALGGAVIRIWSNLPQDVQDHLFKERWRLKASPPSLPSSCMTNIRARHPLGDPREMKEPDSLGG